MEKYIFRRNKYVLYRFRCGCAACSRRYPVYRDLASLVPDAAAAELSQGLDTARRSVARGELAPARAQLLQLLQRLGQHHQAGHTLTHAVSGVFQIIKVYATNVKLNAQKYWIACVIVW